MNSFKNYGLKAKLFFLCSFFLFFTFIVGATSFYSLEQVVADYDKVTDLSVPKLKIAYNMFLSFRQVRIELRTLGLEGISKSEADMAIVRTENAIKEYEQFAAQLNAYEKAPGQEKVYSEVETAFKDFKSVGVKVIALWKSGQSSDLKLMHEIFLKECPEKAEIYRQKVFSLVDFFQETLSKRALKAKNAASFSHHIILSLLAIVLIGGIILAGVLSTAIAKNIFSVINKLIINTNELSEISGNISQSSTTLSEMTLKQEAAVLQTTTSIEQMNKMVANNLESTKESEKISQTSKTKANVGKKSVQEMKSSMNEIHSSNEAIIKQINISNSKMEEIIDVIHTIGEKTAVINEIVFQTKLLSFNASVEAARAGEHGLGFAVVAEEVGKLAQMSGNAANEISIMLNDSAKKVESIAVESKKEIEMIIMEGKAKVNTGVEIANRCDVVLAEVVDDISNVSEVVSSISDANQEQIKGVHEISSAVKILETTTSKNAQLTRDTETIAEDLLDKSESLKQAVIELEGIIKGVA